MDFLIWVNFQCPETDSVMKVTEQEPAAHFNSEVDCWFCSEHISSS